MMSEIVIDEENYDKPVSIKISTGDTHYDLLVENGKITVLANGAIAIRPVTGNVIEISTVYWRL